jgi:hypothetical protein
MPSTTRSGLNRSAPVRLLLRSSYGTTCGWRPGPVACEKPTAASRGRGYESRRSSRHDSAVGRYNSALDYNKLIADFRAQLVAVERAIAEMERLGDETGRSPKAKSTRGRKSMGAEERLEVSRRMSTYWARLRGEKSRDKWVD